MIKSYTSKSVQNMNYDAGVLYRNIVLSDLDLFLQGTKDFDLVFPESAKLGATTGGTSVAVTEEFIDIEVDGRFVSTQGLKIKQSSEGVMTVTVKELSIENLALALNNPNGITTVGNYKKVTMKECLEDTDYLDNVVLLAKESKCNDEVSIIVFENVINTNGFNAVMEDGNQATVELSLMTSNTIDSTRSTTLPITIYKVNRDFDIVWTGAITWAIAPGADYNISIFDGLDTNLATPLYTLVVDKGAVSIDEVLTDAFFDAVGAVSGVSKSLLIAHNVGGIYDKSTNTGNNFNITKGTTKTLNTVMVESGGFYNWTITVG